MTTTEASAADADFAPCEQSTTEPGTGAGTGSGNGNGNGNGQVSEPGPGSDGTEATAGGGVERIKAFDGLFLRAEHLNRIQDHARALAESVGEAGGPGAVEGFTVTVADGSLHVGAGHAVTTSGVPLRSDRLVTLPLTGLRRAEHGFWWVEAVPASWQYGEAPVQGASCDDPCSGSGTTRRLYEVQGVRIRLTEATAHGLEQQDPERRRNWLAAWQFERERLAVGAWPYGDEAADLPRRWAPPKVAGKPEGVRLAALLQHGGPAKAWETDTWIARRDRGAPPPERYWQARLGMRPWDVFIAQVLQFQDQLADATGAPGRLRSGGSPDLVARELKRIKAKGLTKAKLLGEMTQLIEDIDAGGLTGPPAADKGVRPLCELGFDEVPPAGYLPVTHGGDDDAMGTVRSQVETYLGDELLKRYCVCALPDVAQAVQEARHRDRIRLSEQVDVDILVPVETRENPSTQWVAFVRRDQRRYDDR
ncbi:hypothetical protein [Streptomyces sp. NPDC057199]|uniref:hypothetical protein n=1 Tax=Streptomyces sp. NPDC057199 TaxID=3346047 RepID=UPI003633A93B